MINNLPTNAGDMGSVPGPGRFPGEGNGNPLQCSYLENPMGRAAQCAMVHGVRVRHDLVTEQQQEKTPERDITFIIQ